VAARGRGLWLGVEALLARLRTGLHLTPAPVTTHCPHCGTAAESGVPSCPFCAHPLPVAALPAWRRNGVLELAAVAVFFVVFAILFFVILAHDRYR
jgi:hypothetical protein